MSSGVSKQIHSSDDSSQSSNGDSKQRVRVNPRESSRPHIMPVFSRHDVKSAEKVMRLLISEPDTPFYTGNVNLAPSKRISCRLTFDDDIPYGQLDLQHQYGFKVSMFEEYIMDIQRLCEWIFLIPEKTENDNVHIHFVCKFNKDIIPSDFKKLLFRMFMLETKTELKHAVCLQEVTDKDGIIQYLLHKDSKDYEDLINRYPSKFKISFLSLDTQTRASVSNANTHVRRLPR